MRASRESDVTFLILFWPPSTQDIRPDNPLPAAAFTHTNSIVKTNKKRHSLWQWWHVTCGKSWVPQWSDQFLHTREQSCYVYGNVSFIVCTQDEFVVFLIPAQCVWQEWAKPFAIFISPSCQFVVLGESLDHQHTHLLQLQDNEKRKKQSDLRFVSRSTGRYKRWLEGDKRQWKILDVVSPAISWRFTLFGEEKNQFIVPGEDCAISIMQKHFVPFSDMSEKRKITVSG